ncbi:outer membrane receptor protein involved in Fe transport [Gillisia mitskevichiae]|uniref:Outer membrane receptor protein involved in Fe transport n=1 Tax=Gillisia mitskevichiae TaxID=270921 RepID=A0A495PT91_9FLAO|nr:TonB-dependent receptor [Gillisia mitskevichiae]RKS53834.1 outer membrane receptor protein involved in Fe transport [Gillisia mitskevichiae]
MKQLILILSLFSLLQANAFQASKGSVLGQISGMVVDKDLGDPIPYATVLINNAEGKLVSGNSSQDDGSFIIKDIPEGTYTLQVQFIGYKTYSKSIEISSGNKLINIGSIQLEADIASLDDVTIVAERSTIEQKIDRKVINIGKDLTTTGASASDIMGNLPTLTVDQDGNIAMRGNDNVRILVDGKPTNVPAAQLLKQIPSTSIKSVELITNPSAKYNPEGMSGIINIILHKNSNLGFNANVSTGVTFGKHTRANGSLDMNYRTGKFNFYTNIGGNFGKKDFNGRIFREESNSQDNIFVQNDNNSYLYKIGVDFYLNDKNTFSFYTNQNKSQGEPIGIIKIENFNDLSLNLTQNFFMDSEGLSSSYNFDYKREFEKEGHNIELELNYNEGDDTEIADFEFEGGENNFLSYRDDVANDNSNTTINLDYVNPLSEKSKLELGAEARMRETNNTYITTNSNLNNANYNYDNNIYSFYTTYGQTFEKWSYQLGARLEQYDVEAVLDGTKIFEDDYLTVYPTAYVTYTLSDKKTLQLNYGRRVDRPSLSQVNPVREFSTPRITGVGNPELDPQFTSSVEFNYTQNLDKGNFTGGVFYRFIQNEINQTFSIDPEDPAKLLLTYINGEDNNAFGLELSGSYKPNKWWSINSSFEIYNQNNRGIIGEKFVENENTSFNFRINNSFKATEDLTFQLFGYYRAPGQDLQFKAKAFYFVNTGARYSFLDDKATLSLNFTDIFNTQKLKFTADEPYKQEGTLNPESQTVFIGFSYRFGGGKNKALRRKNRDDNEKDGGGLF